MILQCGQCCGSGCDEVWQCNFSMVPLHHRFYYFLMKIEYQYNFYCDGFTERIRVGKFRMRLDLSTSTYCTYTVLYHRFILVVSVSHTDKRVYTPCLYCVVGCNGFSKYCRWFWSGNEKCGSFPLKKIFVFSVSCMFCFKICKKC